MTRTRLKPTDRKAAILSAAVACARRMGYDRFTRDAVALEADCSSGLVSFHFSTMIKLKRSVMREAIQQGIASIVADGMRSADAQVRKAPAALQAEARALLEAR